MVCARQLCVFLKSNTKSKKNTFSHSPTHRSPITTPYSPFDFSQCTMLTVLHIWLFARWGRLIFAKIRRLFYTIHSLHSYCRLFDTIHSIHSYCRLVYTIHSLHSYCRLFHARHSLHSYCRLFYTIHSKYSYCRLFYKIHSLHSYCKLFYTIHSIYSYCRLHTPRAKSMYNVHLERKRGGGWCFFTQIEPNWPLPYSTVPVQCREPKTGQEKVQFYCEDDWLWPSCYYLSMTMGNGHCR